MNDLPTTISTRRPPEVPLDLPRFTFVIGADALQRDAINDFFQKRTLNTFPDDFRYPLLEATTNLFWPGGATMCEIDDWDDLDKVVIPSGVGTLGHFIGRLYGYLQAEQGNDFLGRILSWATDQADDASVAYLFFNPMEPADLSYFVKRHGGAEVLVCILGNTADFRQWAHAHNDIMVLQASTVDRLLATIESLPPRTRHWKKEA